MEERTNHLESGARRWAIFESTSGGRQVRISRWTTHERTEDALTSLLEGGESPLDVYIVSEADPQEATRRRGVEDDYRHHLDREDWPEDSHPNGCWYCGSLSHPTDCCTDEQARMEAWGR